MSCGISLGINLHKILTLRLSLQFSPTNEKMSEETGESIPVSAPVTKQPTPKPSKAPTPSPSKAALVQSQVEIPVANPDSAQTNLNNLVFISVLVNDVPAMGQSLDVFAIASNAANGNCAVSLNIQQVVYTPNDGFVGFDECTYEACDGMEMCDTAIVTIEVLKEENTPVPTFANTRVNPTPFPSQDVITFEPTIASGTNKTLTPTVTPLRPTPFPTENTPAPTFIVDTPTTRLPTGYTDEKYYTDDYGYSMPYLSHIDLSSKSGKGGKGSKSGSKSAKSSSKGSKSSGKSGKSGSWKGDMHGDYGDDDGYTFDDGYAHDDGWYGGEDGGKSGKGRRMLRQ
jgi:hypothetical protein